MYRSRKYYNVLMWSSKVIIIKKNSPALLDSEKENKRLEVNMRILV